MRLVPATSASRTRETEKKRPVKTALAPWRAKRSSTNPRRPGVSFKYRLHVKTSSLPALWPTLVADLVTDDSPEDAERYGSTGADLTLLDQHAGGKEYGSARETDASGPEHHAEENDQVPVMLYQGIELAVDA
jgi:hypothetical protein